MCHYTHLTPFEREKILFFLAEGKSITEIAHLLNRSKSTISREFRRNAAPAAQPMSYCPLTAQALYKQRREACRPHKRLAYAPLHALTSKPVSWSTTGRQRRLSDGSSWSMAAVSSAFRRSTALSTQQRCCT